MNPVSVLTSSALHKRLGQDTSKTVSGVGNIALLDTPLLGLIASRECPGQVLLETLEMVPQWVRAGRIIVSGFHSPLEQQVLRSLVRRNGQAVKVLARGFTGAHYRPTAEEREPLEAGRMLILTACAPSVLRTTRATALERNQLVLTLAAELVIPFMADESPLRSLTVMDNTSG